QRGSSPRRVARRHRRRGRGHGGRRHPRRGDAQRPGPGRGPPPPRPGPRGPPDGGPPARRLPREPLPGAGPMTTPASEPAAAPALPAWRPLLAIVRYTLRTALPRRRWYGVLALAAASVLFGLLSTLDSGLATEAFASTATVAHFGLLLPVTSLIVGDGVLGAEVRSGTFAF